MKRKADKPEELIKDIVEWDVKNWWRAIEYWEETKQFDDMKGKKVLDIGGRGAAYSFGYENFLFPNSRRIITIIVLKISSTSYHKVQLST